MLHHLGTQHVEGNVLVIAPGDEDDLLLKGSQARDGAGGTGGDGIIVKPDAVIGTHQLDAVLHAVEGPGKGADGLVGHQALYRRNGGHVVFHIVDAGQADILRGHDLAFMAVPAGDNGVTPQKYAVFRLRLAAEIQGTARGAQGLLPGDGVVQVEDGGVPGLLVTENVLLGPDIFLHALVNVQVVGGQIGHHGDVRAVGHGHQLEAGQLQHGPVRGPDGIGLRQQGMADVAAHMDGVARCPQQLGDDGGGSRFAVGPGNGDDGAGADLKEYLHFGGDGAALGPGGLQLRHVGPQARGAEDHVLGKILKISVPQLELCPGSLQLAGQRAQLFPAAAVAGGDGDTLPQQQPQQGRIADADADNGHGSAPQPVNIFPQGHRMFLLIISNVSNLQIIPHSGAQFNHFRENRLTFRGGSGTIFVRVSQTVAGTRRKPVHEESPGSTGQG